MNTTPERQVRTYTGNLRIDFEEAMISLEHDQSFYDFVERAIGFEWDSPPYNRDVKPEHFMEKLMGVGVTHEGAIQAFDTYGVYVVDFVFESAASIWQRLVRGWKVEKIKLREQGIEEELQKMVHV